MIFVVEFHLAGELAGRPIPSLNALEAETLPLAVRAVQKTLDAAPEIDHATVYQPVRVLRASRRVEITDPNGRIVAVDAAPGSLDDTIRPAIPVLVDEVRREPAEATGGVPR